MSRIEGLLSSSFANYRNFNPSIKHKLSSSILEYCFRVNSASDLSSTLKEVDPLVKPGKLRHNLMADGNILCNVKLFTYACCHWQGLPGHLYGVSHKDSALISSVLDNNPKLNTSLHKYRRDGYKPITVGKMSKLVGYVLENTEEYTAKFVNAKLRFIVQSNGIRPEDIQNDLFSWALYAIYRAYPKVESPLHAVNIAKQAIHNRGINFIKENTSQSRERFTKHADGTFGSVHVPIHLMNASTLDGGDYITQLNHLVVTVDGKSADGLSTTNVQDSYDLKVSISSIYRKQPSRLKRLMKLWSGDYDEGFSKTLPIPNDEWVDKVDRKTYVLACVDYVGVPRTIALNFMKTLKSKLNDYH